MMTAIILTHGINLYYTGIVVSCDQLIVAGIHKQVFGFSQPRKTIAR